MDDKAILETIEWLIAEKNMYTVKTYGEPGSGVVVGVEIDPDGDIKLLVEVES